ncbi:DUF2798 domain-containing protein [Litoribrevibacter albus]|uniref:DUF2798 domain-containing protein n=1 Tax=Litoribrevibacter albus TaxID=1473156 RepID=UPI0032AFF9FD
MSFFLSSLMSLWVTYINLGFTSSFISQWIHAFSLAWPAAAVIAFFVGPLAQKITQRLLSN